MSFKMGKRYIITTSKFTQRNNIKLKSKIFKMNIVTRMQIGKIIEFDDIADSRLIAYGEIIFRKRTN